MPNKIQILPDFARPWTITLISALLLVVVVLPDIPDLQHNFDEGVYIQQTLRMSHGQIPGKDFFSHTFPAYVYLLKWFTIMFGSSLYAFRGISLVSLILTVAGIEKWLGQAISKPALGMLLAGMAITPVTGYFFLAMPVGVMTALALWGAYLAMEGQKLSSALSAGSLLALSVLIKPVAAPVALLVPALLLIRDRAVRRAAAVAIGGIGTTLVLSALLNYVSDGSLAETIRFQIQRVLAGDTKNLWAASPVWKAMQDIWGTDSMLVINLEHIRAGLLHSARFEKMVALYSLIGATMIGLFLIYRRFRQHLPLGPASLSAAAIAFALGLAQVFVWKPSWDHYLVLFLAFSVLVQAEVLRSLANAGWPFPKIFAILLSFLFVADFVFHIRLNILDNELRKNLSAIQATVPEDTPLLAFDPFVNFVANRPVPCDMFDILNVYETYGLAHWFKSPFVVYESDLMKCLADQPFYIYPTMFLRIYFPPGPMKVLESMSLGSVGVQTY